MTCYCASPWALDWLAGGWAWTTTQTRRTGSPRTVSDDLDPELDRRRGAPAPSGPPDDGASLRRPSGRVRPDDLEMGGRRAEPAAPGGEPGRAGHVPGAMQSGRAAALRGDVGAGSGGPTTAGDPGAVGSGGGSA